MAQHGVNIVVTLLIGMAVGVIVCMMLKNTTTVQSTEKFSDYTIQGVDAAPRAKSVADSSNPTPDAAASGIGSFDPSNPVGNEVYGSVGSQMGLSGSPASAPTCYPRDRLTAEDLLPKDAANSKWAQLNPVGQGDVQDQNFLTAGYHVGVNTQGQSLRNANYQLRSEPANPQQAVSPWNIATIEPDINRKALEIGGDF